MAELRPVMDPHDPETWKMVEGSESGDINYVVVAVTPKGRVGVYSLSKTQRIVRVESTPDFESVGAELEGWSGLWKVRNVPGLRVWTTCPTFVTCAQLLKVALLALGAKHFKVWTNPNLADMPDWAAEAIEDYVPQANRAVLQAEGVSDGPK